MNEQKQFETISLIRAYAKSILSHGKADIRPSTAKFILRDISRLHVLKDDLEVQS